MASHVPDLLHGVPCLPAVPRARTTDPQTSHAAARSMRSTAAEHHERILGALEADGDLTPEQIADRCGLDSVQVCRRMAELERLGLAWPTSETRKTRSGRMARVWRVC